VKYLGYPGWCLKKRFFFFVCVSWSRCYGPGSWACSPLLSPLLPGPGELWMASWGEHVLVGSQAIDHLAPSTAGPPTVGGSGAVALLPSLFQSAQALGAFQLGLMAWGDRVERVPVHAGAPATATAIPARMPPPPSQSPRVPCRCCHGRHASPPRRRLVRGSVWARACVACQPEGWQEVGAVHWAGLEICAAGLPSVPLASGPAGGSGGASFFFFLYSPPTVLEVVLKSKCLSFAL
jgi:hypothetical protein